MTERKREKNKQSDLPDNQHKGQHEIFVGSKKAVYGGVFAGVVALAGQWLVGQVYNGYQARELLETVVNSALFFASSIVTAAATIIALMLTMLSMTRRTQSDFEPIFFKQIQRIALLSTIALSAGILLLLFLSMPLQESDQVPSNWFTVIYYILITFVAGLSSLTVGIVLMLLSAINSLIDVVSPSADEETEKAKEREETETEQEKERIDEDGE